MDRKPQRGDVKPLRKHLCVTSDRNQRSDRCQHCSCALESALKPGLRTNIRRPSGPRGAFLVCKHLCVDGQARTAHCAGSRCTCSAGARIWPLCYSFGVLPDEIVFPENEEGAVDGEAVLFDGIWVVNGHCPCSLGHRLLVNPLATRSGAATPGCPSPGARSASPCAACAASIAGGQIFSESSHSGNARIRQGKSNVMSVEIEGRRITTNTFHPNQSVRRSAITE